MMIVIAVAVAVLCLMAALLLRCLRQVGRIGRGRVRLPNKLLAVSFGEGRVRQARPRLEIRGCWIVDGRH